MVGNNHKHCILEPRFFFCQLKEQLECIVSIFYPTLARFSRTRDINATFWIGKRAVVAHGHPVVKERFACFCLGVHLLNGFARHILITYPPDVGKSNLFRGKVVPIYNIIAITCEEVFHIVKITIAPIEVFHAISFGLEDTPRREFVLVILALNDTLTRGRRHTKG